jgi:hypothetical protein
VISQKELKDFREISEKSREITARHDAYRKNLIGRLGKGEDVQPGKLGARLDVSNAQRFSYQALVDLLGMKKADEIKAQLPISQNVGLKVLEVA